MYNPNNPISTRYTILNKILANNVEQTNIIINRLKKENISLFAFSASALYTNSPRKFVSLIENANQRYDEDPKSYEIYEKIFFKK